MTPERLRTEPLRSWAMGLFLEEACKLVWRSVEPRKKRNLIAKPQKSLQLYVPVPPLTSMLTPQSTVGRLFFWVNESFRLASCAVPKDSMLNFRAGGDSLVRSHLYRRRNNTVAKKYFPKIALA